MQREKMLGIIGAMNEEVAKLKELMDDVNIKNVAGMSFYEGVISKKNVVVVKCGVGKVNAAMCTQVLVDLYNASGIINTGVAGSLNPEINIGDIVLAEDTLEHDMDAVGLGFAPGINPDMDVNIFKTNKELYDIAIKATKNADLKANVFSGRIVSGDQFISSKEKKKWLVDTFGGMCAEMEGAAIGHAAYLNNIPYLVVRSISDKADDSAEMDYPSFKAMAIENSILLLTEIIKQY